MATVTVMAATDWSTSASAAISAAVTEAGVGGTIIFPAGTYRITEPITPLTGQTLIGESRDNTVLMVDFSAIANFVGASVIKKSDPGGFTVNPNVSIRNLCIDGGRSQCGRPNYEYGDDCPYGAAGGISLGVGWTVSNCRLTNINGPKTGCFGAHNARLEYNVWDNDGGGTGGEEDNIGGGGVTGLQIVGNVFKENCAGSGIDITTGGNLLITDNKIGFRSLIMEGIIGAKIQRNVIYRSTVSTDSGSINIKSNTAYASAQTAGAWCSRDMLIENNTVYNSYSPGIIISSTWDDKGPGDIKDGGKYGKAAGIHLNNNWIYSPRGLGVWVGGQDRAIENGHVRIENTWVIDPRQDTGGLGDEWSSGAGYFKLSGIGLGSANGAVVMNTTVLRTNASAAVPVNVVQNGSRQGSGTVKNSRISGSLYKNMV